MSTGSFHTFLLWQRNRDRKVRHTSYQLTPKSRQQRKDNGASGTHDEDSGLMVGYPEVKRSGPA